MEIKKFANDTFIFIYDGEILKTITDPEVVPYNEDDRIVIDGFEYEVDGRLVDMDENKIYVYLK